jgi:glycosyltransferase involved in cell wall biosynthesis
MNLAELKGCILFSTADWDAPYWTNKQHTASLFSKNGIRVLYIESIGLRKPNLGSMMDIRRIIRRLVKGIRGPSIVENNIYVFSPLILPFLHGWAPIKWFNGFVTKAVISRFIKKNFLPSDKIINWAYHPYSFDLISHKYNFPLVYHCVDDLTSVPGIDGVNFKKQEEFFLKEVDIVFTTSIELYKKCSTFNLNTHYHSNVVDFSHFSKAHFVDKKPQDIANIDGPIIGYVGVLSDYKVNFELLYELAIDNDSWQMVLIGNEREGQNNQILKKLKLLNNVHLLGFKSYKDLPSYLRFFDIGLLPTLINTYTKSMFPMKYFEYLAAGIPVVSTPLDFLNESSVGVKIGSDSVSFSESIKKQLYLGKLSFEESKIAVGENTWEERLNKMIEVIAEK